MFGTSLEEVMEMQKEKFPQHRMPWVVQALVDAVVELQGPTTEGIFRLGGGGVRGWGGQKVVHFGPCD